MLGIIARRGCFEQNPSDRIDAAKEVVTSFGGEEEQWTWKYGQLEVLIDSMCIVV